MIGDVCAWAVTAVSIDMTMMNAFMMFLSTLDFV
jgi:hypothetical protein